MRDERRENERYQRASLLDQARDELATLRRHPKVVLLIVLIVGGSVALKLAEPPVAQVEDLGVGDCLYIPNPGAGDVDGTRAVGAGSDVAAGLLQAGAERAPCDASHGHEVAAAFRFEDPVGTAYPGSAGLALRQEPGCESAFASYVGRPLAGSTFELTVAVPREVDWTKGRRTGVCLVSRADGRFMDRPARGSGL